MAKKKTKRKKKVSTILHSEETRTNIPSAEHEPLVSDKDKTPIQLAYERRNRDLDPQLVWRGKDEQDLSDLIVQAPPLYIQEKVHPKALIDDLMRRSNRNEEAQDALEGGFQGDLFGDFDGEVDEAAKTEFYQHDQNWTNRMILGDSLQVMGSLAEREGLRGKVQCIYLDPPYGINFKANFQWSTTSTAVKENVDHITREPEMVKAFRDTWRDGVNSYLSYLRERLILVRELLAESGSIFVQIGDAQMHNVRALLDETFGASNYMSVINFRTKSPLRPKFMGNVSDYILWYSKNIEVVKYRKPLNKEVGGGDSRYNKVQLPCGTRRSLSKEEKENSKSLPSGSKVFVSENFLAAGTTDSCIFKVNYMGNTFKPGGGRSWKTNKDGMDRMGKSDRLVAPNNTLYWVSFRNDYPASELTNNWFDTQGEPDKTYIVQTSKKVIQRCLLMVTDPGDIVLDPTCGSGTTAFVAEQWGRRWITIDTSRVALALARSRLMGARYPYYLLADSREGQTKEADLSRTEPSKTMTYGNIRHGFVYERVPHISLSSITHNTEIDVIWDTFQEKLEPLREQLNQTLGESWEEWEIPREIEEGWSTEAKDLHSQWWEKRIARQEEIDASISAKADYKYLYDKPYEDKSKVRVAGPFTVESLSPHRTLAVDENDELVDHVREGVNTLSDTQDFTTMILEQLKRAGVQQAHKEDKIDFDALEHWPGRYVCAVGSYLEGEGDRAKTKRAAIFVGPEFGTVSRADLVAAAREAADAGFDALISCAFNYDAHSTEFDKLGAIPVLKARMNADLHMADDLKNTGKGNLFVIFGEPDIEIQVPEGEDPKSGQIQVQIHGVDVFDPQKNEVRSDNADGIACWFIDTDYDEESFFVRHSYFLGANDPYKALKTTLKAEIDPEAWSTLNSDVSRPFDRPSTGRIAVKVINALGDEVMKVFRVE